MTEQAGAQTAGPRCPTCDQAIASSGNPVRPFCSMRCKLIDLGRWLDGNFRVPGPPLALPDSATPDRDE